MEKEYNPFSLSGKTIVITGASSGIGRQCAIECSKVGAKVVLIGRNKARLNGTYESLCGNGHIVKVCDLTDFERLPQVVSDIIQECGPIDGVLNAAGISTTLPLKLMSAEKLDEFFKSNVYSAILLSREICKLKHSSKNGVSIVFYSSIMGSVGDSGKSLYSMTKGALVSAVRSLAVEFAKRNIRFNAISPGAILTPINANLPHMADPELRKQLEEKHLLGLGQTEDVAYASIYLLSDASRWVTGTNMIVDGGYTVR